MTRIKSRPDSTHCGDRGVSSGSPRDVKDYCRKTIETCAPGGGFILAAGTNSIEGASLENLRAMVEAAAEYGVYAK